MHGTGMVYYFLFTLHNLWKVEALQKRVFMEHQESFKNTQKGW